MANWFSAKTKSPEIAKATNAVMNQPAITLNTPATLAPADLLPHALSDKEVPIATIKVT